MNKENFIKYVNDFSSLDTLSLDEIKQLIDEFPYFQTAWILYVKNLHKIKDIRYENKLKIAATHIGDRKLLKHIIEDKYKPKPTETLKQHDITIKEEPEETISTNSTIEQEAVVLETPIVENTTKTNDIDKPKIEEQIVIEDKSLSKESETNTKEDVVIATGLETKESEKQLEPTKQETISIETPIVENTTKTNDVDKPKIEEQSVIEDKTLSKESEPNIKEDVVVETNTETKENEQQIETSKQETTGIADKILKNIEDLKTGKEIEETNKTEETKSSLEEIIESRLKELNKPTEDEKTIIKNDNQKVEEQETVKKNDNKIVQKTDDNISSTFNNDENKKILKKNIELNSEKKNALIDKFLSSNPRIVPQKNYKSNSLQSDSSVLLENSELFSETLAKIYIKQEHYDKAILTYEKLCLKYPEKNIYFATQIKKIKELIKNKQN